MSYDELNGGHAPNSRLIDAMVEGRKKSTLMAYMLWFAFGGLGAHNFYLGMPVLGGLQFIGVFAFAFVGMMGGVMALVALVPMLIVLISLLVDMFLIPSRVRAYSDRLRMRLEDGMNWTAA